MQQVIVLIIYIFIKVDVLFMRNNIFIQLFVL